MNSYPNEKVSISASHVVYPSLFANPTLYEILKHFVYVENKSKKLVARDNKGSTQEEFQWNKHTWNIICKNLLSHLIFGFDIKLTTQLLERKLKSHLFEHHKQCIAMHKRVCKPNFSTKYVWTVLYTADHCYEPACFGVFSSFGDALSTTQQSVDLFCNQVQHSISNNKAMESKHIRYQKTLLKSNLVLETQHLPLGNFISITKNENAVMNYYREIVVSLSNSKERLMDSFVHRWRIEKWTNPHFQETLFSQAHPSAKLFCDIEIICYQSSYSTKEERLEWNPIQVFAPQIPFAPSVPVPSQYMLPYCNGMYNSSCIFILKWYQSYRKENFGHILKIFSTQQEAEDAMLIDAKQYCLVNEVKFSVQIDKMSGMKSASTEVWGDQSIIWSIEKFFNPFQY